MVRGQVKFFNEQKNFGRITGEDGEDYFVHRSEILTEGLKTLVRDEGVEFDVGNNEKGICARNVRRLEWRVLGSVSSYVRERGYGYITPDEGSEIPNCPKQIFVHFSDVDWPGRVTLVTDERLEFTPILKDRKWQAKKVKRLDPRRALDRFSYIHERDQKIIALKELAQDDWWEYQHQKQPHPFPILRSYLYDTFDRITTEGKIAFATDRGGQQVACFNTGLVTPLQEQIYAYFTENRGGRPGGEDWFLFAFIRESDRRLDCFAVKPEIANYFSDPAELLYDTRLTLVVNLEHIARDNKERFPEAHQEDEYARIQALNFAIEGAKKRVRGNYKAAIPQFYQGQLQLLLPLCLTHPSRADLALVVERTQHGYRASTVLPLDWAYENARLIARPDREWLQP